MTDGVINLRRARKERARAKKRAEAKANAAFHGRSKAEKTLEAARNAQQISRLEGHKRETDENDSLDE